MKQALKTRLARVWSYVLARAQESSTWRGVVLMSAAFGANMDQTKAEAFVLAGLAIAGLIAVLFPDRPGTDA